MAAERRGVGRAAIAVVLALALTGCAGTAGSDGGERGEVRAVLGRWSAALLARDAAGYLAEDARPTARQDFARPAALPLDSWEYALTSLRTEGGGRAFAAAELRYRLAGYDTVPATTARDLELARTGGRWRIVADRPGPGAHPQLWDQGRVTAVRGAHSLVLGVEGGGAARRELLADVSAAAERAVPAASAAWPRPWARKAVVLVPGSLDAMAALLGEPPATYRGMAAVTTGRVGDGPVPADRVTVNPQAYGELGALGRRVVLAHEVTHVATRAATSAATPLWLSEGFADWAAYRGSGRTPEEAAPALARAVRRGDPPGALPADRDFAFGGDADALAASYEGAWLACRMMAQRWGERAPADFYAAVSRSSPAAAFASVLGTDEREFTASWRAYLRELFG
ncbi:hypothetical protein [Streptomyces sp. NBC_00239]|uniref:hypothetical protein n=1 Tax=Streptomyces sp. NBC_00239 TaxID=2903640 RepID=UPI002E291C2E|nr:hypothetical protein [Streptomyces sp. NBC_00239]